MDNKEYNLILLSKYINGMGYSDITNVLFPIILNYASANPIGVYKLKKVDVSEHKIALPPKIEELYHGVSPKILSNQKFGNELLEFSEILEQYCPKENLKIFYNNINTLIIKENKHFFRNLFLDDNLAGFYRVSDNSIHLKDPSRAVLFHELLHLASGMSSDEKCYNGFYSRDGKIGKALNEGYTELLNKRIFGNNKSSRKYAYFKRVSALVEEAVGQEVMESCYFNANLYGLANELSVYSSEEETIEFLASLDLLFQQFYANQVEKERVESNVECLRFVGYYLMKIFTRKITNNFSDLSLIPEIKFHELSMFFTSIESILSLNSSYKPFSGDEFREMLKKIISEIKMEKKASMKR